MFEDVREVGIRDAGPVIGDRHLAVVDDDAYRGIVGAPLDGVVDEAADGAVHRMGIDLDQTGPQVCVDVSTVSHPAHRFVGEQVQANGFLVDPAIRG